MRIGSVVGPFPGLYWVDLAGRTVTMRQGKKGIGAEIEKPLTEDEMGGLLDGLLVRPEVPTHRRGSRKPPPPPPRIQLARAPVPAKRAGNRLPKGTRPKTIVCGNEVCAREVPVSRYGRVPIYCNRCSYSYNRKPA